VTRRWRDFLRASDPTSHGVHVYQDGDALATSVADYLRSGLAAADPALVIATADHTSAIVQRLEASGEDVERARASGALRFLDAEAALRMLSHEGVLSAARFGDVVGCALAEIARAFPARQIRVYGEIVDLLTQRGELKSALALEELWHDLLVRRGDFSLLCGYRLDVFDVETQARTMPNVCAVHSHVRPVDDEERFADAVDGALEEVLGYDAAGKVYVCVADRARDGHVPMSELALMWVSEHMPIRADRIIASARARYHGAPLAPSR